MEDPMDISSTPYNVNPLLTIVTPTYNRLPSLTEALDSVLRECENLPVEIIVVDGYSTDGTWEWLQKTFADKPWVRCMQSPRTGPGRARNVALSAARGRHLLPIDSDFLLIEGALAKMMEAAERDRAAHSVLFFRCIEHPGSRVMDSFAGPTEITREMLLFDTIGEMVPLVNLDILRSRGLKYPDVRMGGEGILWIQAVSEQPGLFLDVPAVLYRTDVLGRQSTPEFQLAHAADMAAVHEAFLPLYVEVTSARSRRAKARRLLATGTYHLLAGHKRLGARRLFEATVNGSVLAPLPIMAAVFGQSALRRGFLWQRRLAARG